MKNIVYDNFFLENYVTHRDNLLYYLSVPFDYDLLKKS